MNPIHHPFLLPRPHRQSGIALLIALIALAAMAMAGIALIRSVDTNVLVASNMAFRQTARESTDAGLEAARKWLMKTTIDSPTALESDSSSSGYYAIRTGINLTGTDVRWEDNTHHSSSGSITPTCLPATGTDTAGNVACYVIQRMCDKAGPFNPDICDSIATGDGDDVYNSRNDLILAPDPEGTLQASSPVYRVTIRAAGPRNTWSYVQVFIAV
ncbi:MAG: hypothetical protein LBP94_04675 [Zoogloeaceae bacterium]|nr:hypothetical protein [Zoogloeaceae bacterium]